MSRTILGLFEEAQSDNTSMYESAFSDLRLLVERTTMNRFDEIEIEDYLKIFHRKDLIDYRLTLDELDAIKHFLIYVLFTFPDRTVLIAKCLKVLFDASLERAICYAITLYIDNDDATSELIFVIINESETQEYLQKKNIVQAFQKILSEGGPNSREIVHKEFSLRS